MVNIAVVGCTGKLGSMIMKNAMNRDDVQLKYAIARKGNANVGQDISVILGGADYGIEIIDEIEQAADCDVFIDCTNADTFIANNLEKYNKMGKAVVVGTTGFDEEAMAKIKMFAEQRPVFLTGNFSIALHDFIETLKFAVKRISADTDIQIIEYHHNQKKDAPSGTARMIKEALAQANPNVDQDSIDICSVRGGNIFGEHEVVFANCKDEVITFRHQVSSRETFASGAVEVALWMAQQKAGFYNMDDFCKKI